MLQNIYNETVTILNKLKRTDSITGLDEWHKTVLHDVAWYTKSARNSGGNGVYIGTYITVLIPFHDNCVPYLDWITLKDKDNYYTISSGDYIILGDVQDEVNSSNVVKVTQKYGENVCLVKHHNMLHDRFGARVQLKIEGV